MPGLVYLRQVDSEHLFLESTVLAGFDHAAHTSDVFFTFSLHLVSPIISGTLIPPFEECVEFFDLGVVVFPFVFGYIRFRGGKYVVTFFP